MKAIQTLRRAAVALLLSSGFAGGTLAAQDSGSAGVRFVVQGDSATSRPAPLFTRRELVLTAIFTAASVGLMQLDPEIQDWMRDSARQNNQFLSDRAEELKWINEKTLMGAQLLTWGVGRLSGNRAVADIGFHAFESVAITTLVTTGVRVAIGRSRPFVTNHSDAFDYKPFKGTNTQAYRSFPSLHSAAAFATAAAVTGETRRRAPEAVKYVAPASFFIASLPGLARMYADKHWASDVALGAVWGTAIGIATVRYHHERPGNRFDRWMLARSTAPFSGEPAVMLSYEF